MGTRWGRPAGPTVASRATRAEANSSRAALGSTPAVSGSPPARPPRYPRRRDMTIDLAVATPAFLDLTFVGLEALPAPGEERFAADLLRSPGGGAIIAIGAARLGLRSALAAPLGEDVAGDFVRTVLQDEGVTLVDRRCRRMPTTVVMPVAGDRAMVTVDPGVRASAGDVAALEARAVAVSLGQLYCVPSGAAA